MKHNNIIVVVSINHHHYNSIHPVFLIISTFYIHLYTNSTRITSSNMNELNQLQEQGITLLVLDK